LKIACVLADGYEDAELDEPLTAFREAGHDVVVIGFEAGRELTGKRGRSRVRADRAIEANGNGQFDALFIPGGYSPDKLRADDRMVAFARAFFDPDRPVLAICHGPQLLMTARVVRDRRVTAWKTIQDDLHQVGADVIDADVVVDGNLVTSRQPSDIPAFIRESLALLDRVLVGPH
jgi:protease I